MHGTYNATCNISYNMLQLLYILQLVIHGTYNATRNVTCNMLQLVTYFTTYNAPNTESNV